MSSMDHTNFLNKTPTKIITTQDPFQLPDTPSSLASSYNKDVIYPLQSSKKTNIDHDRSENNPHEPISIHSLQSNSMSDFSKGIKYNALHDSIESFISDRRSSTTPHNNSILGDFQDLKLMIADKRKNDTAAAIHHIPQSNENDADLIQKWLKDRKRWDTIQQTYEQKVTDIQNKLKHKTVYFNQKLDSMTKQELKYQEEIKNLNQQIKSSKSAQNDQLQYGNCKLERNYQELSENNRELNTKYQSLQESYHEKENSIQKIQRQLKEKEQMIQQIEIDNKNITQNNNNLIKDIEALKHKYEHDIKTTKDLNEDLIHATKENERLKQLELTSQNMVERLLKRLEQQIHSAENAQQQLNFKEREHDQEIMRLEQINSKLQQHLAVFNQDTQIHSKKDNNISPSSPCSTSSGSSIFTLSTVMTTDKEQNKHRTNAASANKYNKEMTIDVLKKENISLKQTLHNFREMLQIDGDDNHQWIQNTKEFAKQTVFIEKLKNDITQRDDILDEHKHCIDQLETIIDDQKETIHKLEHTVNEQRNNVAMLEKSNSDISLQIIEERSLRQQLQKEIEDLQFENKQLRKKLIVFKKFASESRIQNESHRNNSQSTQKKNDVMIDDRVSAIQSVPRPASANNAMNKEKKDRLLLERLRDFLDTYEHNDVDLQSMSDETNGNKCSFNTAQRIMVNKGNFVHRTMNRWNIDENKTKSKLDLNHNHIEERNVINVTTRRKRKSNYRKRSVSMGGNGKSVYNRNSRCKLHRNVNKSKNGKGPDSTKVKLVKGGSAKSKRRKSAQSAHKRNMLKTCMHNRHWT